MSERNSITPVTLRYSGPSLDGRSRFVIRSGNEQVTAFWLGFLERSPELKNFRTPTIQTFLALATAETPAFILESAGDTFLLSGATLHEWLFYWKYLDHQIREYTRRQLMYLAISAVRYCIAENPSRNTFSPLLTDMIRSKEFATFILDEWDGLGFVGVTRTTGTKNPRTIIREFHFNNRALGHLYLNYFESGFAAVRIAEFKRFGDEFEASLGDYADGIKSFGHFSEVTLFAQVDYFRRKYLLDPQLSRQALRHVVGFYRYVVDTEAGCHIFDYGNFSANILKSMSVIQYLADGWKTISYRSIGDDETRTRLIVIFKDVRDLGTRHIEGDAVAVDLSQVETPLYRNLLWRYARTNKSVLLTPNIISQIADAMHIIESLKKRDPRVIRNADTQQLTAFILERDISDQTVNSYLSRVRNFLDWAVGRCYLEAETEATLNILRYRTEGVYTSRTETAIPLADMYRILGRLEMESHRSHRSLLIYTAVMMLATTQFRASQICIISPQYIRLYKDGAFCIIDGVTKTSHGDKSRCVTSRDTFELLTDVINTTAVIRERCFHPAYNGLLFAYIGPNGWTRLKETDIKEAIAATCEALELPRYTTKSFRKTFATVADEYDRLLGYHGEMAAQLMNHRDKRTTREHYIDRSFTEFQRVKGAELISTDDMLWEEYNKLCERND